MRIRHGEFGGVAGYEGASHLAHAEETPQLQEATELYHLKNGVANGALTEQALGTALRNIADMAKEQTGNTQRGTKARGAGGLSLIHI
eukprot:14167325-Alexandrium_andersonii.AAC.1